VEHLVAGLGVRESYITATGKGTHFGHSVRYVYERIARGLGFTPIPMAKAQRSTLAWRAARKVLRLSVAVPFSQLASAANAGVVIGVILKKEADE
jgi:hypothetical protein